MGKLNSQLPIDPLVVIPQKEVVVVPSKKVVLCGGQIEQQKKTRNKKPYEPVQNDDTLEEYREVRIHKKSWLAPRSR